MRTVVVCDAIHESGFELLRGEDDIHLIDASKVNKDELLKTIKEADGVITRSSTDVDDKFLEAGSKLKAIVRAGVGVDNVDIDACSKKGVVLMNVPTANTIAAVELTMAHLLGVARSFPYAHNNLKQDRVWKREAWYGVELNQKKLGVIGFGNIGSRVAIRAKAFGMDIIAYDPYIPSSKVTDLGMRYTKNFDDILACDFITIHTPKNKETINMIDEEEISKMKDGVRLVNCARGGLYNEKALVKNLKSKKIAYLGIDVFDKEPATDHPFLDLDNVIVTPHLGANTLESQEKIATSAASQLIQALKGKSYPNALNLPLKLEDLPEFAPAYIELTQKMANLGAQINKAPITNITLEASGEISEYIKPMLTFALVGALSESLGDNLNYVNAKFIAKEKGIKTQTKSLASSDYKNLIKVSIITELETITINGTVFNEDEQRIVKINDFETDFKPSGKMIVFKNNDVPGVIMSISSILAKENINIADFRLGRNKNQNNALAVILVDNPIDKKIIKKLKELPTCLWASYAVL
ncbi:MAG: phosphoglycerate dehydrogenase [Proteobacteria bacterium]|nr:MAG: phosphoglycerate dehydrogenase [Pseudomonadota bacterium]